MQPTLLRLPEVVKTACRSKSTIYADIKTGRFPAPVKIGARAIAWRAADVEQWLANLPVALTQEGAV